MAGRRIAKPRTVLEQLLREQDRTYEEIARSFGTTARQLGERGVTISPRHLRRLASGERIGTTPATRRVLQAMFNHSMDELLQPWQENSAGLAGPRELALAPPGAPLELLAVAAQRARGFALIAQTSLTNELMDQVRDDVRELAMLYSRWPLQGILSRLVSTQDVVFTLLEARQVPAHAAQLYFLAGVVGGMLARASHDLSDPYIALTQARTAFVCADRADHDGLRAWIRGLQSMITYWADRPQDSVRYAQSGREFAVGARSTAAIWLPSVEARAWARLGNVAKVHELVDEANRMRDQARQDELDGLGGICTFGRSRQLYCAADALAWLPGQAGICRRYAEEAVEAYQDVSAPDWSFSFQAGSRTDLAIARLGNGEVGGAAEALAPVFELPPGQRTNPVIQSVHRVHAALNRAPPSVNGRTLKAEIENFTDLGEEIFLATRAN